MSKSQNWNLNPKHALVMPKARKLNDSNQRYSIVWESNQYLEAIFLQSENVAKILNRTAFNRRS